MQSHRCLHSITDRLERGFALFQEAGSACKGTDHRCSNTRRQRAPVFSRENESLISRKTSLRFVSA